MILYPIAYICALITGILYGKTVQSLPVGSPIIQSLFVTTRIFCAVGTCYFVLNLPAIHSILVLVLCGFMIYFSIIKR